MSTMLERAARCAGHGAIILITICLSDACTESGSEVASDCVQAQGLISQRNLLTTYAAERIEGSVALTIASQEGDRQRPEHTVNVVVLTDEGTFFGAGSETSVIRAPLQ